MRLDSIPPMGRSILIVEDERLVARDLQLTLIAMGYRVPTTVASADEAIRAASESCPDLVLMDIHIKGERDGIDTAELMRTRFGVPVVYLTAYADDATLSRAKRTQPYGYLLKPVKVEELRSTIEMALYKHAMDRLLGERERWYSTTLKSIGDAVISTDATSLITFMNPAAEALTGWSADEAQGKAFSEVVQLVDEHSRQPISDPASEAMERGGVIRVGGALTSREGLGKLVADSAAPVLDDAGTLLGAVVVLQDVSDRRRLQRQVELADRLASLGTLAAGVAHEVNNPLAAVMTNVQVVLNELDRRRATPAWTPADQDLRDGLDEALQGAMRIKHIVADMMAFARPTQGSAAGTELRPVVEWALRMVSHELSPRSRVVTEVGEGLLLAADETRLGQVLINLLMNAAHAITEGRPDENEVRVTASKRGAEVVLEVGDTGSGMSPEVLSHVFDPFFTTKDVGRGMGLGLAICHGIVQAWGGTIIAESTLGQGTTFRMTLPVATTAATPAVAVASAQKTMGRARILVIDDEPLVRRVIVRVLGGDHDASVVDTPQQALDRIAAGERFDLVLCDLMMPGTTGVDVHEALLRLAPEQAVRIVFMTGGAYTPRSDAFLRATSHRWLPKPFGPNDLTKIVAECLQEWGPLLG